MTSVNILLYTLLYHGKCFSVATDEPLRPVVSDQKDNHGPVCVITWILQLSHSHDDEDGKDDYGVRRSALSAGVGKDLDFGIHCRRALSSCEIIIIIIIMIKCSPPRYAENTATSDSPLQR